MDKFIDICGNPIEVTKVKQFRIVQREYIFRPVYKEVLVKGKGLFLKEKKQIEFACMKPYAAIKGEREHVSALDKFNPEKLKEFVIKDVAESITTTVGGKWNIKKIKYKKYECVNAAGREFSTYLLDVPAQLIRSDGKVSEVFRDDELYMFLGEPIAPAIEMIPALEIVADQNYIFYGKGIHLNDVLTEYNRLKMAVLEFQKEKKLSDELPKSIVRSVEVRKTAGFLENIPKLPFLKSGKNMKKEQSSEEIEDDYENNND